MSEGVTPFAKVFADYCFLFVMIELEKTGFLEASGENCSRSSSSLRLSAHTDVAAALVAGLETRLVNSVLRLTPDASLLTTSAPIDTTTSQRLVGCGICLYCDIKEILTSISLSLSLSLSLLCAIDVGCASFACSLLAKGVASNDKRSKQVVCEKIILK